MPKFSEDSAARLSRAHFLLQKLMNEAIKEMDFCILSSQRGRADQEKAFKLGHTKVHFGSSAHNWKPAIALDIAPLPVDWKNHAAFRKLQLEVIKPLAKKLGIPIRQGIDWDMDGQTTDETFIDLPHVELHPWREWAKKSAPFEG
jgi:hypothetical protein